MTIHRAERADVLVDALAEHLATPPADPFARDVVVVGAVGVERWLAQRLSHRLGAAPGRQDGICAGIDTVRPGHLLAELTDRERDDPWAPDRLAWTVLDVIDDALDEPWLGVVAAHVGHGLPERDAALRRGRRWSTARRTAGLLHGYAVQRPWLVQAWSKGQDTDGEGHALPDVCRWQAELWRRVTQRLDGHPSPDRRLAETAQALHADPWAADLPERLSLLGHTRMPAGELDVVDALARHRDVHLWLPHPSRARWESVAAEGRSRRQARADVPAPQAGNALLTSSGRDVAELQRTLLALPGGADVEHLAAPSRPDTLLGQLQTDIADDVPGASADRRLDPLDRSVQVHACHGPARQVDVLREVVLGLLQDDPTLEPRDVLVMCPDVETFAPLVQAAFGLDDVPGVDHPGHRLRVRLADRATGAVNPVAEVLQRLVSVAAAGRTTASQVRDLLTLAPVRRRFALSEDDLEPIDDWTLRTAVRWGIDADARTPWGLGGLAQNTWAAGLERLATGVAADPADGSRPGGVLPVDDLASTDIDLVGRLHEAVARLGAWLARARAQDVERWVGLLTEAVDAFSSVAPRDAWQREQVLRGLARLGDVDAPASGELTVVEVDAVLGDLFAARPTRTSFRTGSLTVCTMVPMRSVPHRVVCLLGLDADAFPRTTTPLGDDVLARYPLVGERDSAAEDRQLFLDAVMSATEHLVVTYTGASEHTGRPLPPATPVGELLDQLERTVSTGAGPGEPASGEPVREHVVVHHPLQAFDARSFMSGRLVPDQPFSFDAAALAGARATRRSAAPTPAFLDAPLPAAPSDVVTLDDLRAFVSHPVRAFLRSRLDVVLPYEAEPEEQTVPLKLDHLQQWQVNQRLLDAVQAGADGHEAEADERRRGLLPPGALAEKTLEASRDLVGRLVQIAHPLSSGEGRSVDVDVVLPDGRRVVGTVAGVHDSRLVRITPSRLQGRQLLSPWVDVLVLAAAGEPRTAALVGRARYGRSTRPGVLTIDAPASAEAAGLLADLLDLHAEGMRRPLPLPVKTSETIARTLRENTLAEAVDAARWEWLGNRNRNIDGEDVEPAHVLAFGAGRSVEDLVSDGLDQLALTLWTPLLDRLEHA